jgi:hypothetical protein
MAFGRSSISTRRDSGEPGRSRPVGRLLLTVVIIGELVAIVALLANSRDDKQPNDQQEVHLGTQSNDTELFTNDTAGYSFRYPIDWKPRPDGQVVKVTSPDGNAVITVGPGFGGDPLTAADRLLSSLRRRYSEVDIIKRNVRDIGLDLGIVLTGTMVNDRGAKLHFGGAVIQAENPGFAITAFTSEAYARLGGPLQEVLGTFSTT